MFPKKEYYAITDNFETIEFLTLDHAINSKKWLVIVIMTRYEELNGTMSEPIKFEFVNFKESEPQINLLNNKWTGFFDKFTRNDINRLSVSFGLASPTGVIRYRRFINFPLRLIINCLQYFFEISGSNNWEEYEQKQEFIRLKQENEELKNKIHELERQLKSK